MVLRLLKSLLARRTEHRGGRLGWKELLCIFPEISSYWERSNSIRPMLETDYDFYKEYISPGGSAISLELAVFLYFMCDILDGTRLLDLGSGFSSFVLRKYKAERMRDVEVWSVDDDDFWLDKTREYLERHQLDRQHLYSWNKFAQENHPSFDLIFLDIRPITRRLKIFGSLYGSLRSRGVLIIDDVHKPHLRKPLLDQCKSLGINVYDLAQFTRDDYGRYSCMMVRTSGL